ncbi:hypothetical protein MHC_02825 [Mycoplasma haemocanis str. Illinois]|uniref:Uncharacterized protein n=1 Tax=Mycoplasma haemocanis (strain Illinois) TaxID=1111676 RepID=H6N705_MYCHN|nr:hypothetical protein [Mycoplasma haemocanis]AEW45427.1 hypothetical protein MHC_02825 [Mycoplasma haemocanis str. Illinois]
MNALTKAAVATGGVAGIGGGGLLISRLSQTSTISIKSLATREISKTLLKKTEDTEAWKANWEAYKGKDIWGLNKGSSSDVPEEFKDKCLSLLGVQVEGKESEIYSQFLSYCSRDKTIADRLSDEGRELVPDTDNDFWKNKFDAYKAQNNTKTIPNTTISHTELNTTTDSLNKLKNGCKTAIQKSVTDESYSKVFQNIKDFCTKEK